MGSSSPSPSTPASPWDREDGPVRMLSATFPGFLLAERVTWAGDSPILSYSIGQKGKSHGPRCREVRAQRGGIWSLPASWMKQEDRFRTGSEELGGGGSGGHGLLQQQAERVPNTCPFPSSFLKADPKAILQHSEQHRPPALRDSRAQ